MAQGRPSGPAPANTCARGAELPLPTAAAPHASRAPRCCRTPGSTTQVAAGTATWRTAAATARPDYPGPRPNASCETAAPSATASTPWPAPQPSSSATTTPDRLLHQQPRRHRQL